MNTLEQKKKKQNITKESTWIKGAEMNDSSLRLNVCLDMWR